MIPQPDMNPIRYRLPGHPRFRRGFSLIELLVVAAVGALLFTAAALTFRVIAKNHRAAATFQKVALPAGVGDNFYPGSGLTSVDSYVAPNFGRCSRADSLRTLFLEDVEKSIAVFILPRGSLTNTIRGRYINLYGTLAQALDTPEAFRAFLAGNPDTDSAAQIFTGYRGAPAESGTVTTTSTDPDTGDTIVTTSTQAITNATVFLLHSSGSNTQLWIRAVYEIDYLGLTPNANDAAAPDVPCVFASVRRYVDYTLTHYYDCVFRDSVVADAGVPCAHFERGDRAVVAEGAVDAFKKAANQPFYLMWWPDPGLSRLQGTGGSYATGTPQVAYARHEGQTSYLFVIPQFPAL
jgi:prepilin-type N-terminal cleavage/methylation domain-containing protein